MEKANIVKSIMNELSKEMNGGKSTSQYNDPKTLWVSNGRLWIRALLKDMVAPTSFKGDGRLEYFTNLVYDEVIEELVNITKDSSSYSDNVFVKVTDTFTYYWNNDDIYESDDYKKVIFALFKNKVKEVISNDFIKTLTKKSA
jgi:hypothetical protein